MQTVGILIIVVGVWLVYSGVTGISPLNVLTQIIADPKHADEIIRNARAESESLTIRKVYDGIIGGNPFVGWKVNESWASHKARGKDNGGGVDLAAPVGTPIPAPFTGVLSNNPANGALGYTATITLSNGWKFQAAHLSKFNDELNGKQIKFGQVMGWSGGKKGAPGAGSSNGPHVHIHMISPTGVRTDYFQYMKDNQSRGTREGGGAF